MDVFVVLILAAAATFTDGSSIISPPENITVEDGAPYADMSCGVYIPDHETDILTWRAHNSEVLGVKIFSSGGEVLDQSKYEIRGEYNLRIKDVVKSDGGPYSCQLFSSAQASTAILTVLSPPEIYVGDMVEERSMFGYCRSAYGGRQSADEVDRPKMRAKIGDQVLPGTNITYTFGPYPSNPDNYIPSTVTLDGANVAKWDFDGQNLTCEVYTEKPEFYVASSQILEVKFSARDLTFTPHKSEYEVGEEINCTVLGNPEPEVTWSPISTPSSSGTRLSSSYTTATLEITSSMLGDNKWECQGVNTAETVKSVQETLSFYVVPSMEQLPGSANRLIVSSMPILLLAILTLVY